jgi:hypothetical protein
MNPSGESRTEFGATMCSKSVSNSPFEPRSERCGIQNPVGNPTWRRLAFFQTSNFTLQTSSARTPWAETLPTGSISYSENGFPAELAFLLRIISLATSPDTSFKDIAATSCRRFAVPTSSTTIRPTHNKPRQSAGLCLNQWSGT